MKLNLTIDYEKNKFIEGLNLSESGTLTGIIAIMTSVDLILMEGIIINLFFLKTLV